jgi:hypothetical protein
MKTQKIQDKIKETEDKLKELKLKLQNEQVNNNLLYVPELGIEIEIEISHKGESYDTIMQSSDIKEKLANGWRLLSACRKDDFVNEVAFLERNENYAKILKIDGSSSNDDFFVEQIFKRNADKGYVAFFYSYGVESYFVSDSYSDDADSYRGVRFCRKKISRGKR